MSVSDPENRPREVQVETSYDILDFTLSTPRNCLPKEVKKIYEYNDNYTSEFTLYEDQTINFRSTCKKIYSSFYNNMYKKYGPHGILDIYSNKGAFAVVRRDGRLISWGEDEYGGDCHAIKDELYDVKGVFILQNIDSGAFAILRKDSKVFAWGKFEEFEEFPGLETCIRVKPGPKGFGVCWDILIEPISCATDKSFCSICIDDINIGETVYTSVNINTEGVCEHVFHLDCIQPWFINGSATCPLCRQDLHLSHLHLAQYKLLL